MIALFFFYSLILDVTVEGLEAEIMYLEQQIAEAESRLQSMSPSSDAALEMTIQLSANEDLLQVKYSPIYLERSVQ